MTEPRIVPLLLSDMRPEWKATLARIPGDAMKGDGSPKNVFGTLMHAPETLGSLFEYWVTSKERMAFSVREQELVILRMGVLYGCEYVWRHHVPVGREFGLVDAEIEAVRTGELAAMASPRERVLIRLTDEMVKHHSVGDSLWAEAMQVMAHAEVIELIGLIAQYVLYSLTNNVFRVQVEEPLMKVPGLEGV